MSGEAQNVISMDAIWDMISLEAREDWAIRQAACDPKILATIELLMTHDFDSATIDLIKDHLEASVVTTYGVPSERSDEVFGKAETLIWQEMEANG
ncbi:MAG TPA: hypothetical protein VMU97_02705 [Candidatus Dormibacteraeota bacterium]|nr:hypothetical protein [Candidatus Dormibacteraeota bacterium]